MPRKKSTGDPATGAANGQQAADPWLLSQNGYDPNRIYTRSTDGHGQGRVINVRVSPALYHEIQALVQQKAIPELRTYGDVIRDAVIHRMHHYRTMAPTVNLEAVDVEVRQAEVDRINTDRAAWDRFITELDTALTALLEAGETDEAAWLLAQNEEVQSMTPAYLARLDTVLDKHRDRIKAAKAEARRKARAEAREQRQQAAS